MIDHIGALADRVREQWLRSSIFWYLKGDTDPDSDPVSDRKLLNELLETAFLASLTYDERRPTRFSVILWPPEESSAEPGPVHIRLARSLPFDAAHVRRLAPATRPHSVLIGVRAAAEGSSTPLLIWGLVDTGRSWMGWLRHERDSGINPPNYLMVSSSEPGHLSVSRGGYTIATLRGGSIVSGSASGVFMEGPINEFFGDARSECYRQARLQLTQENRSSQEDRWPPESYLHVIQRLLVGIEDQQHGGSLLLIPNSQRNDAAIWSSTVSVKYSINDARIWKLLVDNLVANRKYSDLNSHLWGYDPVSRDERIGFVELNLLRQEIADRTDDLLSFATSLSAVDGAILMTDQFEIIGYGVEVIASAPELQFVRLTEDPQGTEGHEVPIESFGTRHRAAFRFCWTLPQATAFVVSFDGGVRAVRRVSDAVIVWPEILPERY